MQALWRPEVPETKPYKPACGGPVFVFLCVFPVVRNLEPLTPPLALRPPGPEIRSQEGRWTPRPPLGFTREKTSRPPPELQHKGLGY